MAQHQAPPGPPNTEHESCTLRAMPPAREGPRLGALLARWALWFYSNVTSYYLC